MTDKPSPAVGDQYWFDYSQRLVEGATERRDQAAAKLQNLVLWLWGIYTSVTSIGFALSAKSLSLGPTLLIAGGSAALVAVYWATVWVQMPLTMAFDPRSPTSIRRAYGDAMVRKKKRLNFTLLLSIVAAFWVSLAIIVASMSRPRNSDFALSSAIVSTPSDDESSVALTAHVPEAKRVHIEIVDPARESEVLSSGWFLLEDGSIQTSIPVEPTATRPLELRMSWLNSAGDAISLARELKAPPAAAAGAR